MRNALHAIGFRLMTWPALNLPLSELGRGLGFRNEPQEVVSSLSPWETPGAEDLDRVALDTWLSPQTDEKPHAEVLICALR